MERLRSQMILKIMFIVPKMKIKNKKTMTTRIKNKIMSRNKRIVIRKAALNREIQRWK